MVEEIYSHSLTQCFAVGCDRNPLWFFKTRWNFYADEERCEIFGVCQDHLSWYFYSWDRLSTRIVEFYKL